MCARQQVRRACLSCSEHQRSLQLVADEDGSRFLLSEVEILSFALCGVCGKGMNSRFCSARMGSSVGRGICRPNSDESRCWQVWMSVGSARGMSEEGMGSGKRPARAGRWQAWAAKVNIGSECLESRLGAGLEEMGSYLGLEGSGWRGVEEGTSSKCGEAVEWTGSEWKGAE